MEEKNDYKYMARIAVGRVERHIWDAAQVDPNRRKGPAETHPIRESLVEFYSIYYTPGAYDIGNDLQR